MVHDLIRVKKDAMFREAAYALGDNLTAAVKAVGGALDDALEQVAKKVRTLRSLIVGGRPVHAYGDRRR